VQALSWLLLALLAVLGARRLLLIVAALLPPRKVERGFAPSVAVLVSARNEESTVPELLHALERLDYPSGRIRFVLVSDASRDATPVLFQRWVAGRSDAQCLALAAPAGKAEALNRGLALVPRSDLIAVYDADQRPEPSSLGTLAAVFTDPRVGAASGYRAPLNPDLSLVSRYAALESWVHQLVNQAGRDRLGWNPPSMGGNCLYRGRALEQVGGFPAGSFGEDTEVSLALVAGGWQSRFIRGAVAGSALAESLRHYWQQRARWNWGLWKAGRRATGLESWMVVLGYADRLLILAAALLVAAGQMNVLWPALYLAAPCLASVVALWRAGIRRRIPGYLFSPVLLFAVDVAVTLASTLAVVFRRRPKWGGKA